MTVPPAKSVFFKTFGCQMNMYDSERMKGSLAAEGYAETDKPETADLVVFNTCHIREHAAEKVYSEIGRMKQLKQRRQGTGLGPHRCGGRLRGAGGRA